jgi:hypothetical protein
MSENSEFVYSLSLTKDEFNTLEYILGKGIEKMRTKNTWNGGVLGEAPIEKSDIKNVKAIHTRLAIIEAWAESEQPPIDMATIKNAFDRIRSALSEADQEINHHLAPSPSK